MSVTAISTPQTAPAQPPRRRAAPARLSSAMSTAALDALCRQVEAECPGTLAAIYVLEPSRRRWEAVIAPNLSRTWRRFHRAPTGPGAGACGDALVRRRRVVVADVTGDARYRSRRSVSDGASLGACWATPLLGVEGEARGVLALCVARGGRPLRREARVMDRAAELAGFLIEHHLREHHLFASQRRWRGIVENTAVGIALIGAAGRFVMTNRTYRELLGYSGAELRAMTSLDLTHPKDRDGTDREIAALSAGDVREVKSEKRYLRADGQMIWVRVTTSLGSPSRGRAPHRIEVVEDISDRKRVEADLRRTRAHLANAERLAGSGTWIADARTGVLLWSNEMFHIWGLDPEGPQPTLDSALAQVHEDDADRVQASIGQSLRSRADVEGECRLVRPDGSVVRVQYRGRPALGRAGELLEYIGTVRDITEDRRIRDRLQAALDDLRSLAARQMKAGDDERRRIARHLHETTVQDLAAIRLNLGALTRRVDLEGTVARALLEESVALADRSMSDLRTLSYCLHPPLLDEAGLESALRWYAAGFAKRSGIEVRLDLPSPLARLPQEVEMTVFRAVQECLINIYRHAGSQFAAIRMWLTEGRLVTEVQDWGRGMPGTLGRAPGEGRLLGVGIAGMRERLQQLGGVLEIESSDMGTTVRALLPVGSAA